MLVLLKERLGSKAIMKIKSSLPASSSLNSKNHLRCKIIVDKANRSFQCDLKHLKKYIFFVIIIII